ncbi:MAG: N-acetyl-gamma-glutamyl-phosphate reductase [Phycisphaeraceae bacterium]|nr:N-acetyl-gamma-glutamyl-phosphate reductase [Phycisphaeraceae bacterium]MCW5754638.1 N-acetyl-gamma-glutamyl-phosphate reductase [Phycisphaeraceae bacterium]
MIARIAILGASGYAGGELLRLLLDHPGVEVVAATSRSQKGEPLHRVHPNLRGRSGLIFTDAADVGDVDVVFLCLPHGHAAGQIDRWLGIAGTVIDLSADFRLRSAREYRQWYDQEHASPALLDSAVYGLPELHRDALVRARLISGVGCNATAMNLALLPLARAGLIERVIADIKVGSSEGGAEASASSHHPERSGAVRSYALTGHRHAAEVAQELGSFTLDVSVTAIEMVRGVLCTAHVIPKRSVAMRDLWGLYRETYGREPFVRLVCDRAGLHRLPDPKILAGSNYADVGFGVDERSGRIVALCAIDNLMKGAAGSAVQAMNIRLGLPETTGLTFPGLHPA